MPLLGRDDPAESGRFGVRICELVDLAVLDDAVSYCIGKTIGEMTFYEIAGEVAEEGFRRIGGQEKVGEMIHGSTCQMRMAPSRKSVNPSIGSPPYNLDHTVRFDG